DYYQWYSSAQVGGMIMQKVSVLSVNNWKRAQKKPSLVLANDGLMEKCSAPTSTLFQSSLVCKC
ncbi:hypothetical protein RCL44_24845, partial [Salmonella enterica subsp. enterica serovar 1,4,[5],12:i:-]